MGKIQSYKDLLIWQKGIQIVVLTYKVVNDFPKEELYALTSQIKRAVISIPSNIAGGYGRNGDKSFNHFLNIARGLLFELETQLIIASELNYIKDKGIYNQILNLIIEESKMINAFSSKLNTN